MFLGQNLMPNLNMATKYACLESAFENLETISPFPNSCIMAHVSRLKFDAEFEYGNQICLSGKCFSESGNYFIISQFMYYGTCF